MGFTNQSFDPRVGTAQLIFGVIYTMITLIAVCLAFYVQQDKEPYLYYFMAVLFALMAAKSFFIFSRNKTLLKEGVYYEAKVDSIEGVRGITVIKGVCEIAEFGPIYIETRLVGETIARELKKYLEDNKQEHLPALVVGLKGNRPRGMFAIKSKYGHLDEESAVLRDPTAAGAAATAAASPEVAASEATAANENNGADAAQENSAPAHGSLDADGNINLQSPEEIVAQAIAKADEEIKAAKEQEEAEAADAAEAQATEAATAANAEANADATAEEPSTLPKAGEDAATDAAIMDALSKAANKNEPPKI